MGLLATARLLLQIKYSDTTIASQIRAPCECDVVRSNYRSENLRDAIGQNWAHDVEDAERVNQAGLNVYHRVREFQMHELPHGEIKCKDLNNLQTTTAQNARSLSLFALLQIVFWLRRRLNQC